MAKYTALANGLLFTNGYKKETKQPDYVGSAELANGSIVSLSVWKKGDDKNGNDFMSFSLQERNDTESDTSDSK
jgi:hypothetical protein